MTDAALTQKLPDRHPQPTLYTTLQKQTSPSRSLSRLKHTHASPQLVLCSAFVWRLNAHTPLQVFSLFPRARARAAIGMASGVLLLRPCGAVEHVADVGEDDLHEFLEVRFFTVHVSLSRARALSTRQRQQPRKKRML